DLMGHSSAVELQMMRKGTPRKDGCFFHLPYLCLLWLIQNSQTPRRLSSAKSTKFRDGSRLVAHHPGSTSLLHDTPEPQATELPPVRPHGNIKLDTARKPSFVVLVGEYDWINTQQSLKP
ncbi:hypothetical protein KUCAC02_011165, partial [Chaenocephalus aceratus]